MKSRKNGVGKTLLPPTSRDRKIVQAVVRHSQMTREQIRRLYFRRNGKLASVQAACRRLTILTERGYLTRIRLPVTRGSGPYVYQPGKAAAVVLSKDENKLLSRRRGRRIEGMAGLCHGLEVVDFYIALKEAFESRGGQIVTWLGERELRYQFVWHGRRLLFNPDGYCLWALGEEEGSFFLEWDRGTESMIRFSEKLTRYEAYYQLRAYHNHLGEMGIKPRLLVVVPDERREKKLVNWIARKLERGEFTPLPTVLVAARDLVFLNILGRIWCKPGDEHRMRLID